MATTITRPPQDPPGAPPSALPPGLVPEEPPRQTRRLVKRWLLGALIIFVLSAAATVAFISSEITSVRKAIDQNPTLAVAPGTLASAPSGAPQTLLLVGDDRRALTRYYHHAVASHSNEMLVVRFDPAKPWISMLSIPRELWVPIYPHRGPPVTNRINYAYTLGGTQLMTETLKRVLGLSVNHVVVIDFAHFKRAVDQMGCVYSTIDHRYYHSNVGSVEQYQEIDLQPGYQKLCGTQALQFVSYRHGDTSLIRDARNQSFMLDVKKQFGPSLLANRAKFERIFGQAVQTDPGLHSNGGLLDLLTLLIQFSGRPVRQVHFQANLLPTYDTATPQQIHSTIDQFLYGNPTPPKQRTAAVAQAVRRRRFRAHLTLAPTPPPVLAHARSAATSLAFPLEYPRARNQYAGADPDALRLYSVRDPQGILHRAYVVVISRGLIGQYYVVQGMSWTAAPLFDHADQTVQIGARTYNLYYEGSNLKMVAWHEHGTVYWVRNTLTDDVPNSEMLAIAQQTYPLSMPAVAPTPRQAGPRALPLPTPLPPQRPADRVRTYGTLAALVAWLGLAFLAFRLFAGRRELARLRQQVALAVTVDAYERAAAVTHGVSLARPTRALAPERSSIARRVLTAAAALGVAAGALASVHALSGASSHTAPNTTPNAAQASPAAHRAAPAPAPPAGLPSVSVAVLNGTTTPGAAHALAQQLRTRGVAVNTVGNITPAGQTGGLLVFYAPGRQTQASDIARLLSPSTPTLAPLDPATNAAAGGQPQIVVVLH